jgi:nucleotide-binding universal stress UspA family protein
MSDGRFHEVVVGADGSEASRLALQLARRLCAQDARLLAITVAEVHYAFHTGLESGDWLIHIREGAKEIRRQAEQDLDGLPNATARAVDGRASDVLLDAVRSQGADLLALGAGGTGRALGILLGSSATRLVHDSPCSVLVVRGDVDPAQFPQRIVVGIDGSSHAADAEIQAAALAGTFGAELLRISAGRDSQVDPDRGDDIKRDERSPVVALTDASRDADLVVVGSRGLTGVAALGSVAERLAHAAACPVLIVRAG